MPPRQNQDKAKLQPPSEVSPKDQALRRYVEGRLMGLRVNRYSWWTHWRELADYFLPRRYKWIITPNQMARGSPINQHILDSSGCIAARDCMAGLWSGKSSPSRPWFKLTIGRIDSTGNNPVSRWLAECERLMGLVFHESNFYDSVATWYFDLVIFGTATMIIYEDYENVIKCYNPCLGEYYVDINGEYRPVVLYREFTMTVSAMVDEFGYENCSRNIQAAYDLGDGASLTREVIIAHAIEPNNDGRAKEFGFPEHFAFRECYWEWGGSASTQNGTNVYSKFLRKRGFMEQPQATVRWDIVSNDAYGRSPAMDALPDQKQLQLETRRKAQGIDKMVNPPLVADIQLKNQPASQLPGAITYVSGYASSGKPGMSSIYDTKFPIKDMVEDIAVVSARIAKTFFNDLFKTISQYVIRSNVTAAEIDARRAESMVMLGPVLKRIDTEGLSVIIERTWGIMSRAGIIPPPPEQVAGMPMNIQFISMLQVAQEAAQASGIERTIAMAAQVASVSGPEAFDKIDVDMSIDIFSKLMQNDPRVIRRPEALEEIRKQRAENAQRQAQAEQAEMLAKGAKVLSAVPPNQAQKVVQGMTGIAP